MRPIAKFPGEVWDGTSTTRELPDSGNVLDTYREPDGADYGQITAEMIAVQESLSQTVLVSAASNTAPLQLDATTGYGYMPTCAGTPTGVPESIPGFAGFVYDTTGHRIWVYDGGWIATAALTEPA